MAIISNLRLKLNKDINNYLISFNLDFSKPLQKIVFNLTRLSERIAFAKRASNPNKPRNSYKAPNPAANQAFQQPAGDPMDLSAANTNPSRPHGPISDKEHARRRQNFLCIRCGEKGYFQANCPLGQRPDNVSVIPPAPAIGLGRGGRGGFQGGHP